MPSNPTLTDLLDTNKPNAHLLADLARHRIMPKRKPETKLHQLITELLQRETLVDKDFAGHPHGKGINHYLLSALLRDGEFAKALDVLKRELIAIRKYYKRPSASGVYGYEIMRWKRMLEGALLPGGNKVEHDG